jgi:glutamate dehydrogenase
MWATLMSHPAIASSIVAMFHGRFDPRLAISVEARKARETEALAGIEAALAAVESLDEDRILRHFVAAVQAAVRTNFYQLDREGLPKALIAIKFASRKLDVVPLPRPLCASARSRAAASAGPTGRRTSAPKSLAS